MSVSYIPEKVKIRLWGKVAGRCQYEGCNTPLYIDSLTKVEFNTAYIAHIIADNPDGPRGDKILSQKLRSDLSNLMLLCDVHHRLIDHEQLDQHPTERLIAMKDAHEHRIELLTSLSPDKRSHIILYGAKIGNHNSPLGFNECSSAMMPDRFPANHRPIEIGMKNSAFKDQADEFWRIEETNLEALFIRNVEPIRVNEEVQHFSVFALAPQPLLIKLGSLLSDIFTADVYQRHREPTTWRWQESPSENELIFIQPQDSLGVPVLKIAISATVNNDRIKCVLNERCSIWTITVDSPHNDYMKSKATLSKFKKICRKALDKIKATHGEQTYLKVFPAMPVSAAIEFGRVWMPKADLPLIIYDQNTSNKGFAEALRIQNL